MTTKEMAALWGVSETWVTTLCKQNRIPGAVKKGGKWIIPDGSQKPNDARVTREKREARFKFIDLFAGVGGFHQAMRYLGGECVMAAETNQECVKTYMLNYKIDEKTVRGDVNKIDPATMPHSMCYAQASLANLIPKKRISRKSEKKRVVKGKEF